MYHNHALCNHALCKPFVICDLILLPCCLAEFADIVSIVADYHIRNGHMNTLEMQVSKDQTSSFKWLVSFYIQTFKNESGWNCLV